MSEIPTPEEAKDADEYLSLWKELRVEVLQVLESLPEEKFSKAPGGKGWSPAQLGDHLYLSQWGLVRAVPVILGGKFGLSPEELEIQDYEKIREGLSAPKGVKNPEPATPGTEITKDLLLKNLNSAMAKAEKNLKGKTKEQLVSRGLTHGVFGNLHIWDWLYVMVLHERMHLNVLKEKY